MDDFGAPQAPQAYGNQVGVRIWIAKGWATVKKLFWMLILGELIIFGFDSASEGVTKALHVFSDSDLVEYIVDFLYETFVGSVLLAGWILMVIIGARVGHKKIGYLFKGFSDYWNVVKTMVLWYLILSGPTLVAGIPLYLALEAVTKSVPTIAGAAFILLIGIAVSTFLWMGFMFTPYLLIDRKTSTKESLSQSWAMTDGYKIDLYLLLLFFFGFAMLSAAAASPIFFLLHFGTGINLGVAYLGFSVLLLIIGGIAVYVTFYWSICSTAHAYLALYANKFGQDTLVTPEGGQGPYANLYKDPKTVMDGRPVRDPAPAPEKDPFKQ